MNEATELAQLGRAASRSATVLGLVIVVFGVLAILAPTLTGLAVGTVVAALLLAAGIGQTFFAFQSRTFGEGLFRFLFGGLGILCGVAMLARPVLGLGAITMVVGIYLIVEGVMRILMGIQMKKDLGEQADGWGWIVFGGVAALLLAGMILAEWPVSGRWAVGILVGVHLLFQGWGLVMLGSVGQAAADELEDAADA